MSELTLYDLPSKGHCACWSLNPWKSPPPPSSNIASPPSLTSTSSVRLILNYKSIPYTTQWVEYPSVEPLMKSLSIPPNPTWIPYTIPAVSFPDNVHIMESHAIAVELERRYPAPPLHLDSEILPKVEEPLNQMLPSLMGCMGTRLRDNVLTEGSKGFYVETRPKWFGIGLDEVEKQWEEGDKWDGCRPTLKVWGELLRAKGGPFVLGKEVSYADFVIVGFLQMAKRAEDDIFKRVVEIEPALKTL